MSLSRLFVAASVSTLVACSGPLPSSEPGTPSDPAAAPPAAAAPTLTLADKMKNVDRGVYAIPVDGLTTIGSPTALATVVIFFNYQCPFSHRALGEINSVMRAQGDDVRVVIAHRPLPMHKQARPAALAAIAAGAQGKFEVMHEKLFALHGEIDDAAIVNAAKEAGLDMTRFEADRASPAIEKTLLRNEEIAKQFSVIGTPATFVNGRRVTGAQRDVIHQLIDDQVVNAKNLVATGVERRRIYETITATGLDRADRDPSIQMLPLGKTFPVRNEAPIAK